jgi:hypothetical protein
VKVPVSLGGEPIGGVPAAPPAITPLSHFSHLTTPTRTLGPISPGIITTPGIDDHMMDELGMSSSGNANNNAVVTGTPPPVVINFEQSSGVNNEKNASNTIDPNINPNNSKSRSNSRVSAFRSALDRSAAVIRGIVARPGSRAGSRTELRAASSSATSKENISNPGGPGAVAFASSPGVYEGQSPSADVPQIPVSVPAKSQKSQISDPGASSNEVISPPGLVKTSNPVAKQNSKDQDEGCEMSPSGLFRQTTQTNNNANEVIIAGDSDSQNGRNEFASSANILGNEFVSSSGPYSSAPDSKISSVPSSSGPGNSPADESVSPSISPSPDESDSHLGDVTGTSSNMVTGTSGNTVTGSSNAV